MRDAYKGERQVKSKDVLYLPLTSSQIADGALQNVGTAGYLAYEAYKTRARFSGFVREAIQMAIGMMHSQPPEISLPEAMKDIKSRLGEPLPAILRKINTEQLLTGRIAVMADLATNASPDDIPYIATYVPERVINWDNGRVEQEVPQKLNFIVIDESEHERTTDFSWDVKQKYRVLVLGDLEGDSNKGVYRQGVFRDDEFDAEKLSAPIYKGRTLDRIPFRFINSCDVTSDIDDPPLLDLGNITMTIYRADADYRQNLFMQGQDTFVTIGANLDSSDELRIGAGARLDLAHGGDAKYVGVQSAGLSEQRQSLERLEGRAGSMGAQTLDSTSRERESGDSLRIRVAARTADMNQIAITGAAGLEHVLKDVAIWMGENPDEVSIKPNMEFGEMALTGQTMVEMANAANLGFPLSKKTMHEVAKQRRVTKLSYEDEIAQAKKETEDDDFPFKNAESGDRAAMQQEESPSGESTKPSGRDDP